MAYIADTTSVEDRAKGVGLMGAAIGPGMIFGPLLGGVLTKIHLPLPVVIANLLQTTTDPATGALINLSIPFFTSALLALIVVPFVLAFLPESLTGHQMANMVAQTGSRVIQLLDGLRGPIGFLHAMAFLLAFALANMESVLGLYGHERFNIGPTELGMLMGAMGILSVIQQGVVIGPLTR
jgi:DHA1 family multidrug resistance protein-like MFS transporter